MNKIDWTRKLTSRKLWLSIASFVSMMVVALGQSQDMAIQITSLIMAGATVIGYVIGEGLADSADTIIDGVSAETTVTQTATTETAAVEEKAEG